MADDLESADLSATLGAHELVLLHGQPGSAADWVQVAERLPPQLHVVAADRPGYGSSELPAAGFAANARAVLDDLDARGIHRAVLVGHSYGGGGSAVGCEPGTAPSGAGAAARRSTGPPGARRYRAPADEGPAGRSPATPPGGGSSPAQVRPRCRRRCDGGVPGGGGTVRQPDVGRAASPVQARSGRPVKPGRARPSSGLAQASLMRTRRC
jgi:pimeloyl-ACP methyl ester carboxylesterase